MRMRQKCPPAPTSGTEHPGIGTRELDNDAPRPTSTLIVFQQTHITPTLPERPVPERPFSLVAFLESPVPLSAPFHSALK